MEVRVAESSPKCQKLRRFCDGEGCRWPDGGARRRSVAEKSKTATFLRRGGMKVANGGITSAGGGILQPEAQQFKK